MSAPNARWLVASKVATQLGDLLCSAKTTVPWLMLSAGVPAGWLGLVVPVRESGSMLPQIFIAPWVQRMEPRKRAAIGALIGQAIAVGGVAAAGFLLHGPPAGLAVLGALAVLAICRAFASLANKDVLARAIPKGARGKVGGKATSLAGLIGLGAAAASLTVTRPESTGVLALVVALGGLAFVVSALALTRVHERDEGGSGKPRPKLREALADPRLRRFVLVRLALAGSALGGPFIVSLGREGAPSLQTLAAFVLAGSAASFVSAGGWGRLADISGRGCMAAGGALATVASAAALGLARFDPDAASAWWAGVYGLFAVGYVGVRVGRKTYVVDVASGGLRTQFVAASNTSVAVGLLAVGLGLAAMPDAITALAACATLTAVGTAGCIALARA